jgi:hypothetical protein
MARYIMTGVGEHLGNMLTASHEAHAAQIQTVLANQGKIYEELQATRRKVAELEAKLEHQTIQQNRIAATVAQGTTTAPPPTQRNEGQEKKEREQREREKTEGQKRMEAEKEKAPEERRREKGKETAVETEETAETAGEDWTPAGGPRRRTYANQATAATEQEKASVAQLQRRPRPQRLIPVEKYPKAEREVIVNRAILDYQNVKQFPFHLARVTANSNIVLTAAGNVRGVVYTDYVNVIADALMPYGACTAKVHEKWTKFLVRGVSAWLDPEGIRQDIERMYPVIRLAQTPGWLIPAARREGVAESTLVLALLNHVPLSRLGKRIAIGGKNCTIEQYFGYTDYTQCTRCQAYGHVAERCKSPHPRCAVCAGNHVTKDHPCQESGCRKGPACLHPPIKCANCEAPHKARDRLCPHRHNAYRAYHKRRGLSDAEATSAAAFFVEADK